MVGPTTVLPVVPVAPSPSLSPGDFAEESLRSFPTEKKGIDDDEKEAKFRSGEDE